MNINRNECLDCGVPENLHKVPVIDGYEYLCENCLEDRGVKEQERQFTSYWEGE